jgi:hypothetical protein
MSANGIFSPPANPNDGDGYTFGNLVWRYEADNGVWNIVDGALVGSQGPKGDNGDQGIQGTAGATGATGNPYGFKYTFTTSDPPGAGQIYYQYPGNSSTTIRVNMTTSDGSNVYGIYSTLTNASVWIISSTNPNAYWFGQVATVTPSGDNSYITIIPAGAITGSSPFTSNEQINLVYALKGAAGSNGGVGVAGPTGSTGATGPIGGTSGQINFNWNGAASGDANFTINPPNNTIVIGGATATTLAISNRSEVAGGAFSNSQELMDNFINTGTNSITISAGANIQRFRVTPTNTYTVNVSSSGWEETAYRTDYLGCQTITALIQCMNGKTGQFASDIYVDKGVTGDGNQGNAPVLSGVTGGVDIVTVMRYSNGSTAVKIGFHVAKGMTGSGLAF